jgi:release factor glutamine methyltransferase
VSSRRRASEVRERPQTVANVRQAIARQFREAQLDTPDLDARILIGYALRLDHAALAAQADRAITMQEAEAIGALAQRRCAHEPVARILGRKEFWGLPLTLNADTLVPRPATETVVEAALAAVGDKGRPLRIADLGTGSGALLLALLSELPAARGVGTDVSERALDCARANAKALGFAERAGFVLCDYGTALNRPFDLVVANPPYVARGDVATLQPEVRLFDPPGALDGGVDGLDGYRSIATDARRLLGSDGALIVELGVGQADAVAALFAAAGLNVGMPRKDLAGIARALTARALP